MADRRRMQLYINADIADRARVVTQRLPDLSVSSIVNEFLLATVPMLEDMADALEAGDDDAMRTAMSMAMGKAFVHNLLGEEVDAT